MEKVAIAAVAVSDTAFSYDKPYSYIIPQDLKEKALPGCRVMVPFGRGNRRRQGIILDVGGSAEVEKIKPIISVLDEKAVLTKEMLKMAEWMKEHTFCTLFEAVRTMLPAGINMRIVTAYRSAGRPESELAGLGETERQMVEYLTKSRATVERARLLEIMELPDDSDMPDRLVKSGYLLRTDDAVRRMGDATVRMVRLSDEDISDGELEKLTKKQRSVAELLREVYSASIKEICYFTGVTPAVVTALEKKGVVFCYSEEVMRDPYEGIRPEEEEKSEIVLTDEQQSAYNEMIDKYSSEQGGVSLLYGITGSGKTQVFLKLIDEMSSKGRGVIVMVPEISLTPQVLSIFHRRYGQRVAVFHSAMSLGQRMDEWKRVKSGEAVIAVGTRSAVFAPFDDVGLIIMDEEHEYTYKSEKTPRYHARDIARFRCAWHKSLLVLASATPSVESYSAAQTGRYGLSVLRHRYGGAKLPEVVTVDMKEELSAGNTGIMSRMLLDALKENLNDKKQSILLMNRRGYNTYVSCSVCGHVLTCPNCSISLTYHSANGRMMCHYCGYSEEFSHTCKECGAEHIRCSGAGTQKAETELRALLPGARILRMDADSTSSRMAYENNFQSFGEGKYDILLGTQMVAKGLDFPDVTLVGVINADAALYSSDFRSYERAFSLLTQVVGRAGRGDDPGVAVVQTMTPENPIIQLAANQDYEKFYEQEMLMRKVMIYPPYCDICVIGFTAETSDAAQKCAKAFLNILKRLNSGEYASVKLIVLGPSPASIPKVGGKYRWRIIIKCHDKADFRNMLRQSIKDIDSIPEHKSVSVFADMNPGAIL